MGARWHRMALIAAAVSVVVASAASAAHAADTPRRGGVLLAAIAAEPPSLDPHQEASFANIQMVPPFCSTLLQFDPQSFPGIIGDVATEWKIAPDGRTETFKIRPGIRFHDGSTLTAADVKTSYDKIVFPPEGVRSTRKTGYSAIERVDEMGRMVMENAYYIPGLWWTRNVVHGAKVKNWVAPPNDYSNQKLQDVWLSED